MLMLSNDFETGLRDAFARTADEVPDQIGERLRGRDYRPRTHGRPVAAGVAASALLIGGASAILLVDNGSTPGSSAQGSAAAPVTTAAARTTTAVAPVVKLSRLQLAAKAMDDVSGDVFHVSSTSPGGDVTDHWVTADGNTMRVTVHLPDGTKTEDEVFKNVGNVQTTVDIDYATKTWWTFQQPVPTPPADCVAPNCLDAANGGLPPGQTLGGAPLSTDGVKWLISHGAVVSTSVPADAGQYALVNKLGGVTETLYVDKTTNLPVKVAFANGDAAPTFTSEVSWLPATDANVAAISVPVPDGFAQVAPPA
jgi:hypothetical protein